MASFAPIFYTHGHARKTHLVITDGVALCGATARQPEEMWTQGEDMPLTREAVADYLDPDTQDVCCRNCKKKLRAAIP